MSTLTIVIKEWRRKRAATMAFFLAVCLLLLGASALVPRTWTAEGMFTIDPDPTRFDVLSADLQARLQAGAGGASLDLFLTGNDLRVRYQAADAQVALEGLNALLSRLVQQSLETLRGRLQADERRLDQEAATAARKVEALAMQISTMQSSLVAGGESTLGARIGQLQGERDALVLELRASQELRARLNARLAALDSQIAALLAAPEADQPASLARIESELKPQRTHTGAQLANLRDDIALKDRRRKEIESLLQSAQAQTQSVQQESEALRGLQRDYDDAAAQHRQLRLQLQSVRQEIALRVTASALPFRIAAQPLPPDGPDGLPAWLYLAASLVGAALLAAGRLAGRVLVDDRIRLSDTVVADAELPVLAVIADYRPTRSAGGVRWPVVGASLLGAATLAACLAFLVVFG